MTFLVFKLRAKFIENYIHYFVNILRFRLGVHFPKTFITFIVISLKRECRRSCYAVARLQRRSTHTTWRKGTMRESDNDNLLINQQMVLNYNRKRFGDFLRRNLSKLICTKKGLSQIYRKPSNVFFLPSSNLWFSPLGRVYWSL